MPEYMYVSMRDKLSQRRAFSIAGPSTWTELQLEMDLLLVNNSKYVSQNAYDLCLLPWLCCERL